jgi:hypothetical protein
LPNRLASGSGIAPPTNSSGRAGGNLFQGNGGIALIYTDGQDAIDNGFAETSLIAIAP